MSYGKWALALLLAVSATGCGKNMSPNEIADRGTRELGLPVFVWAYAEDECVNRQVISLFDEFKKLKKKTRKAMAERLRKTYDSVILQASDNVGTLTGGVYQIRLIKRDCDRNGCRDNVAVTASYNLIRGSVPRLPGTRITKQRELQIQPTQAQDNSVTAVYETRDDYFFRTMRGTQAEIDSGLASGKLTVVSSQQKDATTCGQMARIQDLF